MRGSPQWLCPYAHVPSLLETLAQTIRSVDYPVSNFATRDGHVLVDPFPLCVWNKCAMVRLARVAIALQMESDRLLDLCDTLCHGPRLFVLLCRLLCETVRLEKTQGGLTTVTTTSTHNTQQVFDPATTKYVPAEPKCLWDRRCILTTVDLYPIYRRSGPP